jgi:hypothetical protein
MVNDAYAPELLRSLFLYDPVTGRLCHKANRRRVKAGSYADSTRRADGYRQVALRLDGKQYQLKAHRVAWILEHGAIPDGLQLTTSMVSVTTTAYAICVWLRSGKTTRTDARQGV